VPNESQQNLKTAYLYQTGTDNRPENKYEIKIDGIEQSEGKGRERGKKG
jgi:hypothetical protein